MYEFITAALGGLVVFLIQWGVNRRRWEEFDGLTLQQDKRNSVFHIHMNETERQLVHIGGQVTSMIEKVETFDKIGSTRLAAHEALDTIQFDNIKLGLAEIKEDLKEINKDLKDIVKTLNSPS